MPIISLQTGKTIYISSFDYYFRLKEEDVDEFYQACIADDLGIETDNPFSNSSLQGKLEIEETPEIEEINPPEE